MESSWRPIVLTMASAPAWDCEPDRRGLQPEYPPDLLRAERAQRRSHRSRRICPSDVVRGFDARPLAWSNTPKEERGQTGSQRLWSSWFWFGDGSGHRMVRVSYNYYNRAGAGKHFLWPVFSL